MPAVVSSPSALPATVTDVLREFGSDGERTVRCWARAGADWLPLFPPAPEIAAAPGPHAVALSVGVGEDEQSDLLLEVESPSPDEARTLSRFLAGVVRRLLRHDAEMRYFSREITERYEEITLLYSISEILASVISLREAAGTILTELVGTLNAHRAALWVYEVESGCLTLAAAVGEEGQSSPTPVDDPCSITARVFRERKPLLLAPGDEHPRAECMNSWQPRGAFLSVPVSYSPPEGETRTVGVINLVGRGGDARFSAGDMKLLSAIASQIGAAVENSRLVGETLRQERLFREMELAHDLQLKLLPSTDALDGVAEVAARCMPAESVGGDFYHLFRLSGGRVGVMIGDVSSHGFGAALIMALTMSAVAIHAAEGDPPSEVLRRVHRTLIDELEQTEMYLTLFYGVIDPGAHTLTYANAGHGHAFRIAASGEVDRLGATNPPLGIVDLDVYGDAQVAWSPSEDLLFLFTDGLSDALGAGEIEGEKLLLELVVNHRAQPAQALMERLFGLPAADSDTPADDRTAVLARV